MMWFESQRLFQPASTCFSEHSHAFISCSFSVNRSRGKLDTIHHQPRANLGALSSILMPA
jgi:hypothetical protein